VWLDPLQAALDEAPGPVDLFLRDDDAGWEDERLFAMLAVVDRHALAIDLAVIPQALTPSLAESLIARRARSGARLGLHQHGLAHRNHEPGGRKCEFGPARGRDAQRRDLTEGQELLMNLLPGLVGPVFTPPWNRCTRITAELLAELGFRVLSRHVSEPALNVPGLAEVPVSVDWSYAKRDGRRLTFEELSELAAERVRLGGAVGVNLHHAVMDEQELGLLDELCRLLATHAAARCRPLLELAGQ
jgi:predicted deacetylase